MLLAYEDNPHVSERDLATYGYSTCVADTPAATSDRAADGERVTCSPGQCFTTSTARLGRVIRSEIVDVLRRQRLSESRP